LPQCDYTIFRCAPRQTLYLRDTFTKLHGLQVFAPATYTWRRRKYGPPKKELTCVLPSYLFVQNDDAPAVAKLGENPVYATRSMLHNGAAARVTLDEVALLNEREAPPPTPAARTFGIAQNVTITDGPFVGMAAVIYCVTPNGRVGVELDGNKLRIKIPACYLR